jgi:glutamyl-tRNA reductase
LLVSVGLNQQLAAREDGPAELLPPDAIEAALAGYAALDGVDEVAVLSTRRIVEVFAWASCPAAAALAIRHALTAQAGRELTLVERHGGEAFRHLLRIASSLDAAGAGDPWILAEVEASFERAARSGAAGRELGSVAARALEVALRVRREARLGDPCLSWGCAAAELAEKVVGPLAGRRAAVVGASDLASLAARHLRRRDATLVVVGAPDDAGCRALAAELVAEARPPDALEDELLRCDVVLSAAQVAPEALRPEAMARIAAARRRPLVVLDLAAARPIPAATGRLRDVYLCDLDDLDRVLRASVDERASAAKEGERVVAEEVARWSRGGEERRADPLIAELQERAAAIARGEVERTLRRVGVDPELERRLDAMAGSIVSKLLHQPSDRLRRAASEGGEGDALVAAAQEIFAVRATRRSNVA